MIELNDDAKRKDLHVNDVQEHEDQDFRRELRACC
jgi:hypothetical protein